MGLNYNCAVVHPDMFYFIYINLLSWGFHFTPIYPKMILMYCPLPAPRFILVPRKQPNLARRLQRKPRHWPSKPGWSAPAGIAAWKRMENPAMSAMTMIFYCMSKFDSPIDLKFDKFDLHWYLCSKVISLLFFPKVGAKRRTKRSSCRATNFERCCWRWVLAPNNFKVGIQLRGCDSFEKHVANNDTQNCALAIWSFMSTWNCANLGSMCWRTSAKLGEKDSAEAETGNHTNVFHQLGSVFSKTQFDFGTVLVANGLDYTLYVDYHLLIHTSQRKRSACIK